MEDVLLLRLLTDDGLDLGLLLPLTIKHSLTATSSVSKSSTSYKNFHVKLSFNINKNILPVLKIRMKLQTIDYFLCYGQLPYDLSENGDV